MSDKLFEYIIAQDCVSSGFDFGKKWYDHPCSDEYWSTVRPIYKKLYSCKSEGKKRSDLPDIKSKIYMPLLKAFIDEIYRAYETDKNLPKKIVEYLISTDDCFKTAGRDNNRLTVIRTVDIKETLNRHDQLKNSEDPIVELPTKLIDLSFRENHENTVEMILNNGWNLSFRIHDASAKEEQGLKFDMQFVGMPVGILSFECRWTQDNLCC